ncbi:MAG: MATE family efflux transporter, partial [Bacteroidota bacterium]
AGDTTTPTKINLIAFWAYQLPFAYLAALSFGWEAKGVFVAITSAEILLAILSIIWFRKGKWKEVQV